MSASGTSSADLAGPATGPPADHRHRARLRLLALGAALSLALLLAAFAIARHAPPGCGTPANGALGLPANRVCVGARAPTLRLRTLTGGTVDLAQLRGHPVLVNFWASWCYPCQREFPLLRSAVARYGGQGLRVVGVLVNDTPRSARAFLRAHGATWPSTVSAPDRVLAAYDVVGLPDSFFLRPNGTVGAVQIGPLDPASVRHDLAAILPTG